MLPLRGYSALGSSRRGSPPHASARGDTGPALGSPLKCQISRSPPPLASRGTALLGFRALRHMKASEDPVVPGGSTPRHLPPSGFYDPLDGLLSSAPRDGPSTAVASLGFSLQGLAPPGPRYPSRGLASLVVLPPSPQAERSRLQRLPLGREGARVPRRPQTTAAQTLPSWDFAPPGLSPSPPSTRLPGS